MNIHLEDERGNRLQREFDSRNLLLHAVRDAGQESRLLKYVDPYGVTLFNGVQVDDLIWDLDDLAGGARDQAALAVLSRVRAFTNEVKMHHHLYIRFVGA